MAQEKFRTEDLLKGALQLLIHDGCRRFDSEFDWKGETWKFSAYKISEPVNLIRIDLRKKKNPKNDQTAPDPLKRPMG